MPPLALPKAERAEAGSGNVPQDDGQPDVRRRQPPSVLNDPAIPQRKDDLGYDGDVEGAFGVARTLKSPGVGEGQANEETGNRQVTQELHSDAQSHGIGHSEHAEKKVWNQQKE